MWRSPLAQDPARWMSRAACAGVPVEWVDFLRARPNGRMEPWDEAHWENHLRDCAAICRRCPVIWECRSFARRHDLRVGVWGGVLFKQNGRRDLVAA